jgi:hypothetical protein
MSPEKDRFPRGMRMVKKVAGLGQIRLQATLVQPAVEAKKPVDSRCTSFFLS